MNKTNIYSLPPTDISTHPTQPTWLPSMVPTLFKSSPQKCIVFVHRTTVYCKHVSNIHLVSKLVNSLLLNSDIGITAIIQNVDAKKAMDNFNLPGEITIIYQFPTILDDDPDENKQVEQEFCNSSEWINGRIIHYNEKYSIQNRTGYWVDQLQTDIKKKVLGEAGAEGAIKNEDMEQEVAKIKGNLNVKLNQSSLDQNILKSSQVSK